MFEYQPHLFSILLDCTEILSILPLSLNFEDVQFGAGHRPRIFFPLLQSLYLCILNLHLYMLQNL